MVNTQLFKSLRGVLLPAATARNHEQAPAYALSARHQLAQLAATGCLSQTFYANAESQLDAVTALAQAVEPAFVAKTAIYARQAGSMKDMPALLAATLAARDVQLLAQVFGRVVDNGKMLRGFVQIVRSGAVGRKSLGSRPKKLVQAWLLAASEKQLLNASVGNAASLADVVKMVHPKPAEAWRAAWFAWLIGKPFDEAALPPITQAFERFKRASAQGVAAEVPEVPFQMLTALDLSTAQWAQIARAGSWQMVRQNLNTFARHGVFALDGMAEAIAAKLRDPKAVAQSRVLPYQLMSAFKATGDAVPAAVRDALQDAMEAALANVPAFAGRVVVCPDVSGSMGSAVTGHRGSATSSVRCIDVAALVAAAVLRKNPQARVLPFEQSVVKLALNARDSVMTNAQALASIGGGGTNCSAPLALLNKERARVDLVILVSDNESWVDATRRGATQTMREWEVLKKSNPQARLVCIDIQPYGTTQAAERRDIMNVGGFSDAVFATVARFAEGKTGAEHWVGEIEKIDLAVQ
ncbi:RNA-binding protein [Caenimonas sedimenti]|uniref:RNA-binding protein n=1 Tax=Caenimonas sedimenti TaxID=2596921 RepID=A0A562ZEF2_9BURK|nr:TROVE domain-containing protein [Caenimonas sedimenti]TWO64914.1 RNA-binding protein [Caenimonas sedimenti]